MREEVLRSLLLIDADPAQRRLVSATASRAGWSVVSAASPETAAGLLQGPHGREVRASLLSGWDAESGPGLIAAMRAVRPDLPVIVLADGGSIDQAVDAMRAGASDFLAKPVAPERLLEALSCHIVTAAAPPASWRPCRRNWRRTCRSRNWSALPRISARRWRWRRRPPATACRSSSSASPAPARRPSPAPSTPPRCAPAARSSRSTARRSPPTSSTAPCSATSPAPSRAPSPRRSEASSRPTAAPCCSTRSASCRRRRRQLLDRVLATGEVRPVGCNGTNSVDVRLIATSSRPCRRVSTRGWRERITRDQRHHPAAARPEPAIFPPLARHCSPEFAEQRGLRPLSIGNDALAVLMRYGWPGNVRQLAGVLFRAGAAVRRHLADRRAFPAHRHPVALQRPQERSSARDHQDQRRRGDGRAAASRSSPPTAICGRWRRSRPTSSALPSAIIAAA